MLNNNKAWTQRVPISTIIAVLLFFGGWAFTEMNNIPKEYISKNQFKEDKQELCDRLERMEKRINARFDSLESKLDAIGRKN